MRSCLDSVLRVSDVLNVALLIILHKSGSYIEHVLKYSYLKAALDHVSWIATFVLQKCGSCFESF